MNRVRRNVFTLFTVLALFVGQLFLVAPAHSVNCKSAPLQPEFSVSYASTGVVIKVTPNSIGDVAKSFMWSYATLDMNRSDWSKFSEWQEIQDLNSLQVELAPQANSARLSFAVSAVNECGSSETAQTSSTGIPFFKLNDPRLTPERKETSLRDVLIPLYFPSYALLRATLFEAVSLTTNNCIVADRKTDEEATVVALRPGLCTIEIRDLSIPAAATIPVVQNYKINGLLIEERIPKLDPRLNKALDENVRLFVLDLEKTSKAVDERLGKKSWFSGSQISAIYQPVWNKLIKKGYSLVRWESHLGSVFKNSTRPFPTDALNITNIKKKISYCLIDLSEVGGPLYLDNAMALFGTVNPIFINREKLGQALLTQSCASYFKSFP